MADRREPPAVGRGARRPDRGPRSLPGLAALVCGLVGAEPRRAGWPGHRRLPGPGQRMTVPALCPAMRDRACRASRRRGHRWRECRGGRVRRPGRHDRRQCPGECRWPRVPGAGDGAAARGPSG